REGGYSVLQHSRRGVERQSKPIVKNRSDLRRGDRDGRRFESRSERRGDRDERRSERRGDRREDRRHDRREDRRHDRRGDRRRGGGDAYLDGGIGGAYYPYDYGVGGYAPYADLYGGYGYLGSPLAYPPVDPYAAYPYGAPMGVGAYGAQPGMGAYGAQPGMPGMGAYGAQTSVATQNTVVTMQDYQFQPQSVTIQTGATVSWQNQGVTVHTATANNGEFDTGDVSSGQSSGGVTFNQPGVYQYTCQYHPQMKGTIVVQ
ncbi:MAG: cupredoxin domain-containing protein, partial [Candidatus Sericytochromatia bacterium]